MQLAFHQPNYLPNLGFFYKMACVDKFVITTNLQFVRREWHNRAKLPGEEKDLLLTVPVAGSNRQMIRDALISGDAKWRQKHVGTIENKYGRTADPQVLQGFLAIYEKPFQRLVDLNVALIRYIKDLLDIGTPTVVDEQVGGQRQDLLINVCRAHGADRYLSGLGGKNYMDAQYVADITRAGISHDFVDRNVTGEYPYSSLHYLLTGGVQESWNIIHGGRS